MGKITKSKGARPSKRSDEIRLRSKFAQISSVNTSTAITSLGNIGTAVSTGILANDVGLQSLTDMFRLYKINSITFEWQPATGYSATGAQIPAGFLGFVPFGTAANPTAIGDFETPLVSEPTTSFATAVATGPLTKETGTSLTLKNSDMPVLQGPGGGWLATQDDGTQGYFGKLFWAIAATTASNAINYLLTTHFDISFKDMLDPSLISKNIMLRHPTGFPSHWEMQPNHPLQQIGCVVQAICATPPESDSVDLDDDLRRKCRIRAPSKQAGAVPRSSWFS